MEIKVESIQEQPSVVIPAVTPQESMPMLLGQSFGMIMQYLGESRQAPAGAPYVAYYNLDPSNLQVEFGFPVASELQGKDTIKFKMVPSGKAVTCIHKGSYATLGDTYNAMAAYIQKEKLDSSYVAYEYYLNSINEVPESELLTKVVMYLK